jgi:hypothetical protein
MIFLEKVMMFSQEELFLNFLKNAGEDGLVLGKDAKAIHKCF